MNHLENHPFAFIDSNGQVTDVLLFDSHNLELLEEVKSFKSSNEYVSCCEYGIAYVNGIWDGKKFWFPKPFPSWVKGISDWEPPIPYPSDGEEYLWSEESISWVKA